MYKDFFLKEIMSHPRARGQTLRHSTRQHHREFPFGLKQNNNSLLRNPCVSLKGSLLIRLRELRDGNDGTHQCVQIVSS